MPLSDNVVKADYGPCLNCSQWLDLVRTEDLQECFLLFCLPTRFDAASMAEQLTCRHCGFSTDLRSYNSFRGQTTMSGLISKSFDTSDSTLDDDVSEISTSLCLRIEKEPANGREEYQSLVDLILKGHACLGCESPLAEDWRFCPKCGVYIEEAEQETETETLDESNRIRDNSESQETVIAGLVDELD